MIGERFGKLIVIEETKQRKWGQKVYKCQCDCGNITYVVKSSLKNGLTNSCGCLLKLKKTKHKMSNTRLYNIWCGIKTRCYNKNRSTYKYYGERGITVCDEWLHDFMTFYNWSLSNGYKDNLTIDRIDINGDYEPNNCRWVDYTTQNNNTRKNVYLTYNGKTQTISQWGTELNVDPKLINIRHSRGWSDAECLLGKEVKHMTELTKRLAFRCTENFYNEVKEIASDKGLSYTDYITFLIMDDMATYYDEKGGE